jgi:hypothetical protein
MGFVDRAHDRPARFCIFLLNFMSVWRADSPAQIAARNKAAQDAQNRETLHAIGGALIEAGQAMQPHGCNGHVQPNGYFTTQCY